MRTILLACAAGMSTSLLVSKMEKAAQEKDIVAKIYAVSVAELDKELDNNTIDIVLLGPQVRYEENNMRTKLEPYGIPLAVINMQDYGMMNGGKVLDTALSLIE
ncbi:UNVERIFIED_CONTAM: PTS sugar transporter subunit IIB [Streptococcus canis]|uniref:PTS system, beta-glucoside-specific, IIB component n=1 Tax=Streptococcus canis FSL Z3-227 TaxID=482234 RepID=A0AAV3FSY5_STRCB|nr:PTS sugar transporter subunit IIB [Streptococcus canis]EIQ82193.1 PTS system, beta-glucoside-specific, IIB component [Streptococcus canis FSL Z3-227]MDV5988554.1 PTS sugar transporter subunit IIB [Streptococcus canis]MDV5993992.1 PTS sugar transporter subunit IIB [Streptococcus canis]MDV6001564.1 PTS sugar transporter subunit IIB [Streptococcus canis]MDW7797105.1 PTS sugar transporter subunit IIB [Streptococcus canis]